jgi:fatty acid desaturase
MNNVWKDYSLTGPNRERAIESGLAGAEWYRTVLPRKVMKEIMQRSDGPAIRDTILWLAIILGSGAGVVLTWGSWWVVPFLIVYGVMYGSAGDSRWHECGHGTAFKTQWMNHAVYHLSSFMMIHPPTVWYWSHVRHHTDAIIVGRDREAVLKRPPDIPRTLGDIFGLFSVPVELRNVVLHAFGRLRDEEKDFVPEQEQWKVVVEARVWLGIYFVVIALSFYFNSIIPLVLIPGGRLYGVWHLWLCGLFQHGGLAEDELDYRLNTRTAYLNPISSFIYWNMNYHIEHHMFPLVPFHQLPKLHSLIKSDCPEPNKGFWGAWREMLPVLLKQIKDPTYFLERELPTTAKPYYRPDLQTLTAKAL